MLTCAYTVCYIYIFEYDVNMVIVFKNTIRGIAFMLLLLAVLKMKEMKMKSAFTQKVIEHLSPSHSKLILTKDFWG